MSGSGPFGVADAQMFWFGQPRNITSKYLFEIV